MGHTPAIKIRDQFGFCGAPITSLEKIESASHPFDVVFFGQDREIARAFGTQNAGAASFIREQSRRMAGNHRGDSHDIGILESDSAISALADVMSVSNTLSTLVRRPVLVACDHVASIAAALGTAQGIGRAPVYIYMDAHFDLGRHLDSADMHNGNFVSYLLDSPLIAEVVNLGGRSSTAHTDQDNAEPRFTCIRAYRNPAGLMKIIAGLSRLKGREVYVSIDADVLDPQIAPDVCCPEPNGMSAPTLLTICQWLGRTCTVVGADVSELVPSERSRATAQTLMACLRVLF